MQAYQYTDNGSRIIDWVPTGEGCGKSLNDCLAEAKAKGLSWNESELPFDAAAAAQAQAAYDAAAAVFESLSLGKRALWEPVRAAVAAAILVGDMAQAYEILATTPAIYAGAEDDRAMFLALFS